MPRPVLKTIKVPDFSDGDPNHRPDTDLRFPVDTEPILRAIAFKYMSENLDEVEPGTFYTLDKLPAGYTCYGQTRSNGLNVDKYIYGHPSHRVFNSLDQFLPHFTYLKEQNDVCECRLCELGEKRRGRKASRAETRGAQGGALVAEGSEVEESEPASVPSRSISLGEEGKKRGHPTESDDDDDDDDGSSDEHEAPPPRKRGKSFGEDL